MGDHRNPDCRYCDERLRVNLGIMEENRQLRRRLERPTTGEDDVEAQRDLLVEAIRVALPYLEGRCPEMRTFGTDDCALVHLDHFAGLSMAAAYLRKTADEARPDLGLLPDPPDPSKRRYHHVYAASFIDDYAKLAGVSKREARATLRERGRVEGDLRPVPDTPEPPNA